MLVVLAACALLVALTTLIHYEVLRMVTEGLPSLPIPTRTKMLAVVVATFTAHMVEILVYGTVLYLLLHFAEVGTFAAHGGATFANCFYFSAETYTALGFGDIMPTGPLRLLAGVEALNGLLMIGWSASYLYISMERFWNEPTNSDAEDAKDPQRTPKKTRSKRKALSNE